MFVARWIIDVRFGHKDEALSVCKRWQQEVGQRVGMERGTSRVLTGSVGAPECRYEFESQFSSLSEMEKAWAEMATLPEHKKFSKDLEQHIVSGSNRWEILRVVDL